MTTVNIHEAKTHLSRLLEQVKSGEDIIIARAGHPVARLVAYAPPKHLISPPGGMKGQIHIADDFDDPLDELFECLDKDNTA